MLCHDIKRRIYKEQIYLRRFSINFQHHDLCSYINLDEPETTRYACSIELNMEVLQSNDAGNNWAMNRGLSVFSCHDIQNLHIGLDICLYHAQQSDSSKDLLG